MKFNIHATCIDIDGKGVLFIGASGVGKSDMALRLIEQKRAQLVADDRTDIEIVDHQIFAYCPEKIRGLLEVRGVGLVPYPNLSQTTVRLVVELTANSLERLPKAKAYKIETETLPLIELNPWEISAPVKVLAALKLL